MGKNVEYIKDKYNFEDLKEIVACLRAPDGCPWDRALVHESIENCLIEESAEVIQAVNNKDMENLCEELGDLLLQVLLHCQIATENKEFTFEDVVNGVAAKLVRRHPNVFYLQDQEEKNLTAEEGLQRWEAIKAIEKASAVRKNSGELKRIPDVLPPVRYAQKTLKKAEKLYGIDKIPKDRKAALECEMENCRLSQEKLTNEVKEFILEMESIEER